MNLERTYLGTDCPPSRVLATRTLAGILTALLAFLGSSLASPRSTLAAEAPVPKVTTPKAATPKAAVPKAAVPKAAVPETAPLGVEEEPSSGEESGLSATPGEGEDPEIRTPAETESETAPAEAPVGEPSGDERGSGGLGAPAETPPEEGAAPPLAEKKTELLLPQSDKYKDQRIDIGAGEWPVLDILKFLADYSGLPVLIDSTNKATMDQRITIAFPMKQVTGELVIAILKANKFLVTRQVLPTGEIVLNVDSVAPGVPPTADSDPTPTPLISVENNEARLVKTELSSEMEQVVRPDEIATMVFTLKYTQPSDAITSLNNLIGGAKGVKSKAFSIVDVKSSPVVIVTAKFGLLNYLKKLLGIIDVPMKEPERIVQIIDVENADADELVQLIDSFLQGRTGGTRTSRGVGVQPQAGGQGPQVQVAGGARSTQEYRTNLIADWRTQKIIIETYSESDLEDINMLVRELDTRFDIRRLKTRIYQVRYLKAEEVAADLQTLIGSSAYGASGRAGMGTRTGTTARSARSTGVQRVGRTAGAAQGASPVPGAAGGAGGSASMPALIVPHTQTNSLIIQAEPEEYAELLNILDQVDVKRRQVFLEAALVQVTTSSNLNYAIELLAGEPNDTGTRSLFESSFGLSGIDFDNFNRTIPDLSNPASVPPGAILAVMNRGKFPALVRFFKSNTDTQVLATPFILADDNQPNVIDILETRYVSNSNTVNTVTTTSQEGEDAGITLEITPTISSKNAVFLELTLEVSEFAATGGTNQVLPPKTTNTITSAVTIPDGEIFVIGGLTRENKAKSVSKVPILGDIPFLGKLFRSESTAKSASNLYIFLRAHVLMHPEFLDGIELTAVADAQVRKFAPSIQQVKFPKPNVQMPPAAATDPDRAIRFPRVRSGYDEGYEAPQGPYEKETGTRGREGDERSSYRNDPESPIESSANADEADRRPGTRSARSPDDKRRPMRPEAREDTTEDEGSREPTGGLERPPRSAATEPSRTVPSRTVPVEDEVPPLEEDAPEGTDALSEKGLEVAPGAKSWIAPVRSRRSGGGASPPTERAPLPSDGWLGTGRN